MTENLNYLSQQLAAATAEKKAVRIRGGGTKDWYGQALRGEILDTRAYAGIISYDPTELVITVRCGTRLTDLEAALAEHKQILPFEPPRFGPASTIGGVIASGLSGPRRQAVGAVRDFVLGAVLIEGSGETLHFGGQVMKNVAGYDVSRLLAGSMGILGLIAEISLKVLPKPFAEKTLRFEMNQADAIRHLNEWGGQPLPISASAWQDGTLMLRLSGAQAAVQSAESRLGGEEVPDADTFWEKLRDQQTDFFTGCKEQVALWRVSLPSVAPALELPGQQLIEWGGALRWVKTDAEASIVRAAAAKAGGHAMLYRGGDKRVGVFHPLAPAADRIHRNLKDSFDPAGIINPGRMYPDF